MTKRRATVLHVDDDEALCRIVREAFASEAERLDYVDVRGPEEALDRLDEVARPVVFLLDRRLPGAGLWPFVDELRSRGFEASPLFVLSGSQNPEAVREAYENGATGYVEKPDGADGFFELAGFLDSFASLVSLPPEA